MSGAAAEGSAGLYRTEPVLSKGNVRVSTSLDSRDSLLSLCEYSGVCYVQEEEGQVYIAVVTPFFPYSLAHLIAPFVGDGAKPACSRCVKSAKSSGPYVGGEQLPSSERADFFASGRDVVCTYDAAVPKKTTPRSRAAAKPVDKVAELAAELGSSNSFTFTLADPDRSFSLIDNS